MEQEELIKERDELFNGIKSNLKERTKKFKIAAPIFSILVGLCIFFNTNNGNISPILCTVMCVCILVLLFYFMYMINKNVKADNAQDFLTFYDKNKQIMKWLSIILCSILTIAIIIEHIIKKNISGFLMIACMTLASYFISYLVSITHGEREKQEDLKNDITRLRELVRLTRIKV